MKKAISLLLALVLCLSLCACGSGNDAPEATVKTTENTTLDKNDVSNYIGVWKSEHYEFVFNKGGIGRFTPHFRGHYPDDFTYEVRDEAIVILIDGKYGVSRASFELNEDGTVLSVIQHNLSFSIDEEPEYIKQ